MASCHRFLLIAALAILGAAVASAAPADLDVQVLPGKQLVLEEVEVTMDRDVVTIDGVVDRRFLGPRRPVAGQVSVTVRDASGALLRELTVDAIPRFVPRDLRRAAFRCEIPADLPGGSTVTVRPLR